MLSHLGGIYCLLHALLSLCFLIAMNLVVVEEGVGGACLAQHLSLAVWLLSLGRFLRRFLNHALDHTLDRSSDQEVDDS